MTGPLSDLAGLAAAHVHAHAALVERARALGARHGLEVLDVRAHADGTWALRLRLSPADAEPGRTAPAPPAAFRSPVPASAPFVGDGTADLPRLLAEADPAARVPPRGRPGDPLPPLPEEERLRLMAETLAGDLLLTLREAGREGDEAAVERALREGRERFAAEVLRAGAERPDELVAVYDEAAAAARARLREEAPWPP